MKNKDGPSLMQVYYRLPDLEKNIVQILSLAYGICGERDLAILLNQLKVTSGERKIDAMRELRPILQSLRKSGLLTANNHCDPQIVEKITWETAQTDRFASLVAAIQKILPAQFFPQKQRKSVHSWHPYALRDLRLAVYQRDEKRIAESLQQNKCYFGNLDKTGLLTNIFSDPERQEFLQSSPTLVKIFTTTGMLTDSIGKLAKIPQHCLHLCRENLTAPMEEGGWLLRENFLSLSLLRGDFSSCLELYNGLAGKIPAYEITMARALQAFLLNNLQHAITLFQESLEQYRKLFKLRRSFLPHFLAIFYLLAVFKQQGVGGIPFCLTAVQDFIAWHQANSGDNSNGTWHSLYMIIWSEERVKQLTPTELADMRRNRSPLDLFFTEFLIYCLVATEEANTTTLASLFQVAAGNGYRWVALECARMLQALAPQPFYRDYITAQETDIKAVSMLEMFKPVAMWEKTVNEILQLLKPADRESKPQPVAKEYRIVWYMGQIHHNWEIVGKEQKRKGLSSWTSGKVISLIRLQGKGIAHATEQDKAIATEIHKHSYAGFFRAGEASRARVLWRMIGHPLLFSLDGSQLEVEKGHLELISEVIGEQLQIKVNLPPEAIRPLFSKSQESADESLIFSLYGLLDPDHHQKNSVIAYQDGPHKWKVIEVTPQQQQILKLIGGTGLAVPLAAKSQAMEALTRMSSLFVVQSALDDTGNLREIAAEAQIYVYISPRSQGFKVEFWVKPVADEALSFKPNTGREIAIAEVGKEKVKIRRRLGEEKHNAEAIVLASSVLSSCEPLNWEWQLAGVEDCLTLLAELQNLSQAKIYWPEGEKLKIATALDLSQLRLQIAREKDWFAVSGQVKIDEQRVLDMKNLIELLQKRPGRFIPLEGNTFATVTDGLRRQLQELSGLGDLSANGIRIHPLAAGVLEELAGKAGDCQSDDAWRQHLERIASFEEIVPPIPSTLQTPLRPYQVEGFQWLCRLAHWGVGACLADDMGLGKTIEALALLLHRAMDGPTLIIAPTSVCFNWIEEARRFAPTLRMILFREQDREKVVSKMKPFDCLVVSYGLLHTESELLAKITWHTIILDEAQAIKNFTTKRSQAAMNLSGQFKMVTTGTPIENHLSELWNLFRFLNPGLLGSLEKFNQRFALPIERDQDLVAQKRLKKLIQPFILRRIKSQVLEELPARTEITLHVDLSPDEAAFYEALRQKALENLSGMEGSSGQQHLRILAEIMKLRRACCHSKLVRPGCELPCSKLELFGRVVEELLENKHKALIFSQFVDYLAIVRQSLDAQGIVYQYLDGSTSQPERKKRIEAFQSGQGDLFLLSLKAGGLGINLTAADYVIHLDPWWNPAVEDQAADRAHRIGQERPVTIYRLVTRHTIEEKIIELHKEKRDLASSLLSGTEINNKISAEELLAIIREE